MPKEQESIQLNIFEYRDFRRYLKDYYKQKKERISGYSYRRMAKEFGFGASNFLHLVIQGKRNLALDVIDRLSKVFKWCVEDKSYFKILVQFNQEINPQKKQEFKKKLAQLKTQKNIQLSPQEDAYFSRWYIPVIREIIALKSYVNNLNWISRKIRPGIGEEEVKTALEILKNLGLIKKDKGKWVQAEEHLTTGNDVPSKALHELHKKFLDLAMKALDYPLQEREITAMTMSLSKEHFERLKKKLIEFRDEIQHDIKEMKDDPEIVSQLNIQFFRLTND